MSDRKTMMVKELIAALLTFHQDMLVEMEGCDCQNPCKSVIEDHGTVLLRVA